ncbi:MAG: hypothetical protein V1783_01565, partial [Bacteroidota bacterium]
MNLDPNFPEIISFPEYDQVDEVMHFTNPKDAIEHFQSLKVIMLPEPVPCTIKMAPMNSKLLLELNWRRWNWNRTLAIVECIFK